MESSKGIFLYWSAGSGEGKVDVTIQQSHFDGSAWSNPRQVAHHVESRRGVQLACWNPVPVGTQRTDGPVLPGGIFSPGMEGKRHVFLRWRTFLVE